MEDEGQVSAVTQGPVQPTTLAAPFLFTMSPGEQLSQGASSGMNHLKAIKKESASVLFRSSRYTALCGQFQID